MAKVQGVEIGKVSEAVVAASVAKYGLRGGDDLAASLVALTQYFRRATPQERLADCLTCHGVADVSLAVCPFCGDGEEESGVPVAAPVVATPSSAPVVATERQLDAAVARVQRLKRDSAGSLWELGSEILRIYETQLWKLREDDKGGVRWRTWGQFAESELGVGPSYAYKLMDVAKVYDREQVRALGATKLHVTLQVPKEHRDRLLASAARGASVADLQREAALIGKATRETGRGNPAQKEGVAKGKPTGRKPDKITVAALVGRVEIPLMKGMGDKPARSLTDVPRGTERLLNGVTQVFVVSKDEEGRLLLIVERVRE